MHPWYAEGLVCPIDRTPLVLSGNALRSQSGRSYPVVDDVPVLLVGAAEQTIGVAASSLARARNVLAADSRAPTLHLESLGLSDAEKDGIVSLARSGRPAIDPVVAFLIGATSGDTYKHLIGNLEEYPIPDIPLPARQGASLLDLGCNWGRWSVAAAKKGYAVTGIDPSLGAVMAARRVALQQGVTPRYLVADARFLPFRDGTFDVAFSYSVLQHLSKANVRIVLSEVRRVLRPAGESLIQMPNWLGVRSFYHQARRFFRAASGFEVRYWSIPEMKSHFESAIGPSTISVDCYFGLGLQPSDRHLMPRKLQAALDLSERIRSASRRLPVLKYLADSVYVRSKKADSRSTTT